MPAGREGKADCSVSLSQQNNPLLSLCRPKGRAIILTFCLLLVDDEYDEGGGGDDESWAWNS